MAYDLTAAADGTQRDLGNKKYSYNATKGRWDRVPSGGGPIADVTVTYPGKSDGNNYNASLYVAATVTWNQAVTGFTIDDIKWNAEAGGNEQVNFGTLTQDTIDTNKYTFSFQFPGAVGQFYIPANSVTSATGLTNPLIYSPAIPGVYKPYPVLTLVNRTAGGVSVYSVNDTSHPNFAGVIRYFITNLGSAAGASTSVRIKTVLQNFANVLTSSYTTADIVRTVFTGTATFNASGMFTTPAGTTNVASTADTRYTDLFFATNPSTNNVVRLTVNASTYTDGTGSNNNDASAPLWFATVPNAIALRPTTIKPILEKVTGIKVNFDLFLTMLQRGGGTLQSTLDTMASNFTSVGGGTLSNPRVDATDTSGTTMTMTYTPAQTPHADLDYTETLTFPLGWGTFNGTTGVTKDPAGAADAFTTRQTPVTAIAFQVVRSRPTTTTTPANGSTGFIGASIILTFSRPVYNNYLGQGEDIPYSFIVRRNNSNGDIAAQNDIPAFNTPTITFPFSAMIANTTYHVQVAAGSYKDAYDNLSSLIEFTFTSGESAPSDFTYTGQSDYSWQVPPLVTSISVLLVGFGQEGGSGYWESGCSCAGFYPDGFPGGRGGGLSYRNNITVIPGETLTLQNQPSGDTVIRRGGPTGTILAIAQSGALGVGSAGGGGGNTFNSVNGGGGYGGARGTAPATTGATAFGGGAGGGGAGGYSGAGGAGANGTQFSNSGSIGTTNGGGGGGGASGSVNSPGASGGGVGLYGKGANGAAGAAGTPAGPGGDGSTDTLDNYPVLATPYGAGGGGSGGTTNGGPRGGGAIRIVWPGTTRTFPNTNVNSQTS
jgi:hypothetical protein